MIAPHCDEPRAFWRELLLAVAVACAPALVEQVGGAAREAIARRNPPRDP